MMKINPDSFKTKIPKSQHFGNVATQKELENTD